MNEEKLFVATVVILILAAIVGFSELKYKCKNGTLVRGVIGFKCIEVKP